MSGHGTEDAHGREASLVVTQAPTRRFGEAVAVDGLDLDVRTGEVFGLLGAKDIGGRMRRLCISSVVVVLMLAACGSDVDGDGGETLEDFLGGGQDPDAAQAAFESRQRELEERTADCMAEEGFEYVPRDPGAMRRQAAVAHPRDELSEDDFREEYGYGISTMDAAPSEEINLDNLPEDPNVDIQRQMDAAGQQDYQVALDGEPLEPDPGAAPGESMAWEPSGCRGEAMEAMQGSP